MLLAFALQENWDDQVKFQINQILHIEKESSQCSM